MLTMESGLNNQVFLSNSYLLSRKPKKKDYLEAPFATSATSPNHVGDVENVALK